jgi:hypothetical protein
MLRYKLSMITACGGVPSRPHQGLGTGVARMPTSCAPSFQGRFPTRSLQRKHAQDQHSGQKQHGGYSRRYSQAYARTHPTHSPRQATASTTAATRRLRGTAPNHKPPTIEAVRGQGPDKRRGQAW